MGTVLCTRRTVRDLLEIWSYFASDSTDPAEWSYFASDGTDAADLFLDMIEMVLAQVSDEPISDAPTSGRRREELAPSIRSFPAGSYVIFYRPIEDGLVVIRIIPEARDPAKVL